MNQQQPFYQANQQANGQFGQRQFGYNFQNPHGYDPEQGAYNNFGYQQNYQYPGSAGGYQPQTGFMGQFNDQFAYQQRSPQNGMPYGPPNMQQNSNNYGPQQPSQYAGQQHPSMGYNGQKSLNPSSDFGYTNYHDQQRQQFFGPTRGSYGSVHGLTDNGGMAYAYNPEAGKESYVFNNGECRYEDGFLYENDKQVRPLTDEEKNQLAQFKQELLVYQEKFSKNMNRMAESMMKNAFAEFGSSDPEMPDVPCFCTKCQMPSNAPARA
ncbi:hypothetical protein AAVH_01886 [Aphelenchoides avenae]|nr:hypothetical protein AAVH_01886 [Aphelenchus avenae]